METNVLIADDHSIVRMGLFTLIKELGIDNIDEVSSCCELKLRLENKKYTHLILDLILTDCNSLEIINEINELFPDLCILIHSMQPPDVYGKILKKFKVHSYLYKGVSESVIKKHLKMFVNFENDMSTNVSISNDNPFSSLAVRELEILHYLLNGYRVKEIGVALGLKMNTISTVKAVIFEKLKVENITQLLQLAHVYQISY